MNAKWQRVVGDTNDTFVARLDGIPDLTGVTAVEAHVWRPNVAPVTLEAAVTDAAARTVTVQLSPWLATATATTWLLEIQASFGTTVRTWPEGNPAALQIRGQGA